jgi:hypothetical protein
MTRALLASLVLFAGAAYADGAHKVFIDIHRGAPKNLEDKDLAAEHAKDLAAQKKHKGVKYTRFWYDREQGVVMCECHAPSKQECEAVHKEAHDGKGADEIFEVSEHK